MAADAKVWVVTGASRGIGAAIATEAAEADHRVAMVARGESVLSSAEALGEMAGDFSVMSPIAKPSTPRSIRLSSITAASTCWSTTRACTVAERFIG